MSTFVNDLRLEEIGSGERSGTWGTATNTNLSLIAEAFSYGTETMGDANTTITMSDAVSDEVRSLYLKITSSADLTTTRVVTLAPNAVSKVWIIENATSGSQIITIKQGSGATVNIPNGSVKVIATDGGGTSGAVFDLFTDLDVAGTFAVAGNTTVGGTLTSTGAITANAGVSIDNITIDGTEIDLSSGDLTLDVAGDIVLNSDDGIIFLKDDTATFGSLNNSSGNLIIKSGTTTAATFSGANVTLAGTVVTGGLTTLGGNLVIPNDGNIGSVGDTDAIDIDSNGVVTMNQIPVFSAGINVSGGTITGTLATAAQTNITSVGALSGGSITSGFGAIDNGSSSITTTGTITGGTITTSGTVNFGSLSDGSITITAFVDEDDMASDSATLVPTQQSVKAYISSVTGGGGSTLTIQNQGSSLSTGAGTINFTGTGVTASGSGVTKTVTITDTTGILTTGTRNTAIGSGALDNVLSGAEDNVAIGHYAGRQIETGDKNTLVGSSAGYSINSFNGSATCVGYQAGYSSSGGNMTCVGVKAGYTGGGGTAIGSQALENAAGGENVAVGLQAGQNINSGVYNINLGFRSAGPTSGDYNFFAGLNAGRYATTGDDNIGIGPGAVQGSSSAENSASDNIGIGESALLLITTGEDNVCIGSQTCQTLSTGDGNVAIGYQAMSGGVSTHTHNKCIAIGRQAGQSISSGTNLIVIGADAEPTSGSATNEITLGDNQISTLRCNTQSISSLSDVRDKKDIVDIDIGLSFINDLRPVNFTWDRRDGSMNEVKSQGFIAQEVDEVQQKHNCESNLQAVMKNDADKLEMSYGKFVPALVKAIQDLSQQNKKLEQRILDLENK